MEAIEPIILMLGVFLAPFAFLLLIEIITWPLRLLD